MSVLGDHGEKFEERNLFLQSLIGLVSLSRRLEGWLEEDPDAAAPLPEDSWVVDMLLGVVALREKVLANLETSGAEAESSFDEDPLDREWTFEDAPRRLLR